jgi:hypothetical protein
MTTDRLLGTTAVDVNQYSPAASSASLEPPDLQTRRYRKLIAPFVPDVTTGSSEEVESQGTQRILPSTDLQPSSSFPPEIYPVTGLQKWEGHILDIEDQLFSAELIPLDHEGPTLIADFAMSLLTSDEDSICVGDLFYLTTRIVKVGPHAVATSSLRLRRLGKWTQQQLDDARSEARRIIGDLDSNAD